MIARLIGCSFVGFAAYALARGVGIPHWVDWTSKDIPADAGDIGMLVAFGLFLLTGAA